MSTTPALVDPRGPRFVAGITSAVLLLVLITGSGFLLTLQAVMFGVSAFLGLRYAPYTLLFRKLVAPRLRPPDGMDSAESVRFAQGIGFVFALVGTVGYLSGAVLLGIVATAAALFAAFLNAVFDYCLGCQIYPYYRRMMSRFGIGQGDQVLHAIFTGLITLAAVGTMWFAGYVVYRMYSDAR